MSTKFSLNISVFQICIGFSAEPDPDSAFYLNADPVPDPDPGSQINADPDPDPGQTLPSQKVGF
jgi:hypothetical protein